LTIQNWFSRKQRERGGQHLPEKLDIPGNLWVKCFNCKHTIYSQDLEDNLKVCPRCNYHFKLTAAERLKQIVDDKFQEIDNNIKSRNFLNFSDSKSYTDRIEDATKKSNLNDAILTGMGKIGLIETAVGIMDFSFMGGSMGSVVGEKVTRLIELAVERKLPVIIFSSSGGARMQEGIMSLMQMAKTSAALGRLRENGLPYLSVMTDPTTGGTTASFAMLGDINLAEPGALIGFAGPRVIEQTIRQKLPAGFQRSEYLLEHGMLDIVCERKKLKETIVKLLSWFSQ